MDRAAASTRRSASDAIFLTVEGRSSGTSAVSPKDDAAAEVLGPPGCHCSRCGPIGNRWATLVAQTVGTFSSHWGRSRVKARSALPDGPSFRSRAPVPPARPGCVLQRRQRRVRGRTASLGPQHFAVHFAADGTNLSARD